MGKNQLDNLLYKSFVLLVKQTAVSVKIISKKIEEFLAVLIIYSFLYNSSKKSKNFADEISLEGVSEPKHARKTKKQISADCQTAGVNHLPNVEHKTLSQICRNILGFKHKKIYVENSKDEV